MPVREHVPLASLELADLDADVAADELARRLSEGLTEFAELVRLAGELPRMPRPPETARRKSAAELSRPSGARRTPLRRLWALAERRAQPSTAAPARGTALVAAAAGG